MYEHRKKWQKSLERNIYILLMHPCRAVSLIWEFSQYCDRFSICLGITGAQKATLTFMVGAEDKDFKAVEPLLNKMGKNIVHAGPNGSGLAAKICNNLLLAIRFESFTHDHFVINFCCFSMIGTSEAMNLGVK